MQLSDETVNELCAGESWDLVRILACELRDARTEVRRMVQQLNAAEADTDPDHDWRWTLVLILGVPACILLILALIWDMACYVVGLG